MSDPSFTLVRRKFSTWDDVLSEAKRALGQYKLDEVVKIEIEKNGIKVYKTPLTFGHVEEGE